MQNLRKGFTLVELIFAVVIAVVIAALMVGGVFAISMMFAIPKLIEDPAVGMAANETAAIQRVETIWDAQGELTAPSFLPELTTEHMGYSVRIFLADSDNKWVRERPSPDSELWCAYAYPKEYGTTGHYTYFINQQGILVRTESLVDDSDWMAAFPLNTWEKEGMAAAITETSYTGSGGLIWTRVAVLEATTENVPEDVTEDK